MLRYILVVMLMCCTSSAFADEYFAVTPSGSAEMLFPDKPDTTIGKLSSKCIDTRWTITSSTSNELVCEAPLNMGQSILGQMLLGNSYSTPPRRFFRFSLAEINRVSRVQASGWMELQMAFGQTKRTDFSGPEFQNNIMSFMASAGGKYPVGTTFPNHVMMGIAIADVPHGKYAALRVTSVELNSPAAKGGLQVGDIVTRIARKPFKNIGGYLDATAQAAKTATYEVEFIRSDKAMTTNLDRAFRPAITEPVVASAIAPAATVQPLATSSVADELAKLAKLKQEGVLNDAEFDAQKKKLLAQ